jgi:hypothetical protein
MNAPCAYGVPAEPNIRLFIRSIFSVSYLTKIAFVNWIGRLFDRSLSSLIRRFILFWGWFWLTDEPL